MTDGPESGDVEFVEGVQLLEVDVHLGREFLGGRENHCAAGSDLGGFRLSVFVEKGVDEREEVGQGLARASFGQDERLGIRENHWQRHFLGFGQVAEAEFLESTLEVSSEVVEVGEFKGRKTWAQLMSGGCRGAE